MAISQQQAQFALSSDTLIFNRVFVLGDSLVDSGNALGLAEWYDSLPFTALPEGAPTEELGYFDGRFTNGYTYADLVANRYVGSPTEAVFPFGYDDPWIGIPIAPFRGDPSGTSLNFAYGGAQVIRGSEFVSGLDEQTDALRDAVDGRLRADDLLVITMGGNDVRDLVPVSGEPSTIYHAHIQLREVAEEMIKELGQLITRGLQNILITGIPNVGLIPKYDVDGDGIYDGSPGAGGGWKGYFEEYHLSGRATAFSRFLDDLVRTEVIPALEAMGATVTYVPLMDVLSDTGEVLMDGALGLVLPTIAALNGVTVQQMEADWLAYSDLVFFDAVHPTAQVHALVGSYIHAQMEGSAWIERMPLAGEAIMQSFTGDIAVAGETDSFTIMLRKGETYTIEVLGMSSLGADGSLADPNLVLTDRKGAVVMLGFDALSGNDSGLGFDANFTFSASATGRYTITVGAEGSLTGSYVVQVGTAAVTGTMRVASVKEAPQDAFLPADAKGEPVHFALDLGPEDWTGLTGLDAHIV